MPITARVLRDARHAKKLTQSELADLLDVSIRTIANWEREGGVVPERSERHVANVLNLAKDPNGRWREAEAAKTYAEQILGPETELKPANPSTEFLHEILKDSLQRATDGIKDDESANAIANAFLGAKEAMDTAQAAADAGVHPLTILKLIEAASAIALESGIGMIPGSPAEILSRDILDRGTEIARSAVDAYVPDPRRGPFPYRLNSVHDRLSAKLSHYKERFENVTPLRKDEAPVKQDPIPENVEDEWEGRYAAHPNEDWPEDHTP